MIGTLGISTSAGARLDLNDIRNVGTSGTAHRGLRVLGPDGGVTGSAGAEVGLELNLRTGGGGSSRSTTVGAGTGCGGGGAGKGEVRGGLIV